MVALKIKTMIRAESIKSLRIPVNYTCPDQDINFVSHL